MNQSTEIKDLFAAFAQAQAEFVNIKADEKARVQTKAGGSFEYSYAGLGAYLSLVRPILAKFKLFTLQGVEIKQSGNAWALELETRLGHESGQWISSTSMFPVQTDPQQAGSVISYMRRYTLAAFLGLATEDDDGASGRSGLRQSMRRSENMAQNGSANGSVAQNSTPAPTQAASTHAASTAASEGEAQSGGASSSVPQPTSPTGPVTWGTVLTRASAAGRGDMLSRLKELRDRKASPEEGLKLLNEALPQPE